MHIEIHAALARQSQEQVARRTRATRPAPSDVHGRRSRRLRPVELPG